MAAAPRAGILRFTYPESKEARIQIDLGRRVGQLGRWLKHSRQYVRGQGSVGSFPFQLWNTPSS